MTFSSMEELRTYILSRSKVAIQLAQEKIYQVINRFVKEYYAEFSPELYDRTYQLFRSLVKTDIIQTSNGWQAEIYFDLDKLDYSIKTLKGIGTWGNAYHRNDWTHENDAWILENAMIGDNPHGGYPASKETKIWIESLEVLRANEYDMLKKALTDAGIPIK